MQIADKTPKQTSKIKNLYSGSVFHSVKYPEEFFIRVPSIQAGGHSKPVTAVNLSTGHLYRLDEDLEVYPIPTAILRFDGATE